MIYNIVHTRPSLYIACPSRYTFSVLFFDSPVYYRHTQVQVFVNLFQALFMSSPHPRSKFHTFVIINTSSLVTPDSRISCLFFFVLVYSVCINMAYPTSSRCFDGIDDFFTILHALHPLNHGVCTPLCKVMWPRKLSICSLPLYKKKMRKHPHLHINYNKMKLYKIAMTKR